MTIKGKEVAGKSPAGKRKRGPGDDKGGGGRSRRNRAVLQFFEDAADGEQSDDSDDSDFSDDFMEEEVGTVPIMKNEPAKANSFPFFPKEEEMDEEEFDRMMEERFGDGSRFITFAGDEFDDKTIEPNSLHTADKDLIPTIWKVKCTVGRERLSAVCLMQKFADLKSLGTKLQIISAFAVDHMKGFVYIEAEKQFDINEACKGISGIYVTRVQPVPKNEVFHLFSARSRCNEISEGMWVRIKNGKYKGDLAQVVAVNNTRKRVTVKLIPRIDLQAMAAKFGGGYSLQKTAAPAPRLISSSELEEFRPLMQCRRDRDTGKVFEVLDGLMLKDGYVYKKVSPDSLNLWGVVPTEEELLKFGPSENNESNDLEWLSQLYGDPKKKRVIRAEKGGGKGESSSGSGVTNGFELYDLVCFRKDFGVIVGMDKDDSYKILKESPDGPVAVTVERRDIKSGLFDLKLSSQDQHNRTILVNDTVRVLEGPSKGRQGIVKHIYRGIVFLYDENEEENGGYFTSKSHVCEKVKLTVGDCSGKGSESGPSVFEDPGSSVFEDIPSSPKSPLSPKRPWQARENNREFNRGDKDGLFTIGQTLRIRIGPLKGYLCRVIALRRSDVTVKLDSQQKVLTVKCEHLSEVQGKSIATSSSADPDSSSVKPFHLLGTEGSSGGWMDGVGTSAGGGGWNAGGMSAERNAWSSAPSFLKPESTSNPISSEGGEGTAWETKNTSNQNSSWGAAVVNDGIASEPDKSGGWGKGGGSRGQWGQSSNWKNKANDLDGNQPSGWDSKTNWNTTKAAEEESSNWNRKCVEHNKESEQKGQSSWNSVKMSNESSATGWGQGNGWKTGSDDGGNLNPTSSGWNSGITGVKEVGNCAGTSYHDENQDAGWKNKPNKDGNNSSGWERKNNWNTPISSSRENSGWNQKSTEDDKEEKGQDQVGWSGGKTSDGSATGLGQTSGWKMGLSDTAKEGSNWGTMKSGSSAVAESQDSDWGKASNWNSVSGDAGGSQGIGWGLRSNSKSGSNYTNQGDCKHLDDSNEKKSDRDSSMKLGQDGAKIGSADGPKQASNWGAWKSGSSSGNENHNSNWSSGCIDAGSHDSNWGKKTNWNSGQSGNQASDLNDSNWNSGSGDSNQNSNRGRNSSRNSNNSSWNAENENKSSNWSSGHTDAGNQVSNWGKKSNWNSGSGDANQNTNWRSNSDWHSGNASSGDKLSGVNETSDDRVGGGNWRGGYRGRGGSDSGFRGRGFWGRGERGGFSGRGERGGFGGRGGERGGFGGRGRSDREGFGGRGGSERGYGGRGRGRSDQPGGWNNKRDSGEDGSSDWKGADNNVEGWKNSNGSGAWSQEIGDKKGRQSWSQGNADKERPSWNQGGGSNKQWQSWSSASGGGSGNWNSKGSEQPAEAKDGTGWTKGTDSAQENVSVKRNSWTSHGAWKQEVGDKKDGQSWSQGNADKENSSWNQGGGSNKQWQSWSSSSGGASGNWNSKGSEQLEETKEGSGWTQKTDSAQENVSVKGTHGAWKQEIGDKKYGQSWSQGNSDKKHSSWNQGGGSNKQWQSWSSSSGEASGNWSSKGSEQLAETKDGTGWTKGTDSAQENVSVKGNNWTSHGDHGSSWKKSTAAKEIEETNIQEDEWNKGPSSNTTSRSWDNQEMGWKRSAGSGNGSGTGDRVLNWDQSSAADKGQSSSWNASIDGAAGSWGKKNDGSDEGGW